MKILIVEDDFTSRKVMQHFLRAYGECDIAVNGREALEAMEIAWKEGAPYDLVTLDVMMPELDGQETLKELRAREEAKGIPSEKAAKVIMTTALNDRQNVITAFKSHIKAYLIKPIAKDKLVATLESLGIHTG